MNYRIWLVVFVLSVAGAFWVHQVSQDPIDWSAPPRVLEKPEDLE